MRFKPIIRTLLVGGMTLGLVVMAWGGAARAQLSQSESTALTTAAQSGSVDQMLAALTGIDMTDPAVAQAAAAAMIQANPEAAESIGQALGNMLNAISLSADSGSLELAAIGIGKGLVQGALATGRTEAEAAQLVVLASRGIMTSVAGAGDRDAAGSVALGIATGVTVQADDSGANIDLFATAAVTGLIEGAAGTPVADVVSTNAVAGAIASGASVEAVRNAAIAAGANPIAVQSGVSSGLGIDGRAGPSEDEEDTSPN